VRSVPWWLRLLAIVAGVVLLLVGLLWVFQRRLINLPDASAVPPAATVLPGASDVALRTADGLDLAAWYVPAAVGPCRPTVIVANGNAGNRQSRAPLAKALADRGFGVLLVDYRGYGGNPGSPSEAGLALDVGAARNFLTQAGIADRELIYFGESLGAAVVTELALEHPPAGLLLRSPFTELAAVGQQHFPFLPVRLLLRDRFPVLESIARIDVPTTVIYGTSDTVVPAEQSRAVADAAGGPTEVVAVPGADHNDRVLLDGPVVIDAVVALATRSGCPPSP
jgi:fermentation-respiration switch protein FrsA (DUF1100 family)